MTKASFLVRLFCLFSAACIAYMAAFIGGMIGVEVLYGIPGQFGATVHMAAVNAKHYMLGPLGFGAFQTLLSMLFSARKSKPWKYFLASWWVGVVITLFILSSLLVAWMFSDPLFLTHTGKLWASGANGRRQIGHVACFLPIPLMAACFSGLIGEALSNLLIGTNADDLIVTRDL